jgi:hypothetical protein
VDGSDFSQFVKALHDLEDDSNEHSDFILECEHSSEPEQNANDNENDFEFAACRND